jgi:hypothetical protein
MPKPTRKQIKQKRDGGDGPILVLPHIVLNSEAYKTLSGNAVKLLCDIAMQYNTWNNGSFLASFRYMSEKRGWTSADALAKAKKELIERELIVQTVQGQRPNKASWYGCGWLALDDLKGLEIIAKNWPRGAYARWKQPPKIIKRKPPAKETREAHYAKLRGAMQ